MCSALSLCKVLLIAATLKFASCRIRGSPGKVLFEDGEKERTHLRPIPQLPGSPMSRLTGGEVRDQEYSPFYTRETFPYAHIAPQPSEEIEVRLLQEEEDTPPYEFPRHLFTFPEQPHSGEEVSPKESQVIRKAFSFAGPLFREDVPSPLVRTFFDSPEDKKILPPPFVAEDAAPRGLHREAFEDAKNGALESEFLASAAHLSPMIAFTSLGGFEGELGHLGLPLKEEKFLKSFRPLK